MALRKRKLETFQGEKRKYKPCMAARLFYSGRCRERNVGSKGKEEEKWAGYGGALEEDWTRLGPQSSES